MLCRASLFCYLNRCGPWQIRRRRRELRWVQRIKEDNLLVNNNAVEPMLDTFTVMAY